MKLYQIKKGTSSIVFTSTVVGDDMNGEIVEYDSGRVIKTSRNLDFMDTILDPVRLHNIEMVARGTCTPIDVAVPELVDLVRAGYALFRDEDHPNYILAVRNDNVEILA